jgi:hypothetical protein
MQENGLAVMHINVAIKQKLAGNAGLFAGKPAPTGFRVCPQFCVHSKSLWERACPRRGQLLQQPFQPEMQNANPKVGVLFSSSAA